MSFTTFNTYGNGSNAYAPKSVPVWLGKVRPLPGGYTVVTAAVVAGRLYEAGSPVIYDDVQKTIVPFYLSSGVLTAGDGTSSSSSCNGYLYNDIYIGTETEYATGAVVVAHNEGILIDRTAGASIAATLKTNVPNVIQVKEKAADSGSGSGSGSGTGA